MLKTLLSREDFKRQVFERDKNTCLFCDQPAIDAHHIIDRKLFKDGGYYLDNGASVCEKHHLKCETTEISVELIRKKANITNIILPDDLDPAYIYDKWGNILIEDEMIPGPLYENYLKAQKYK